MLVYYSRGNPRWRSHCNQVRSKRCAGTQHGHMDEGACHWRSHIELLAWSHSRLARHIAGNVEEDPLDIAACRMGALPVDGAVFLTREAEVELRMSSPLELGIHPCGAANNLQVRRVVTDKRQLLHQHRRTARYAPNNNMAAFFTNSKDQVHVCVPAFISSCAILQGSSLWILLSSTIRL